MMRSIQVMGLLLCLVPAIVRADLSVPNFFSDHMVLQREQAARIWGKADGGAAVKVEFKGVTAETVADDNGRWEVELETGTADGKGALLRIASGAESIEIQDVLVGEVWFASGQSNMVFTMNRVPNYAEIIAQSDLPGIRMFNAPTVTAVEPQEDIEGNWSLCGPATTGQYSAVAFFFARKLHEELKMPIGIIKSAWGGKPVETFTSREALSKLPSTQKLVQTVLAADKRFDPKRAQAVYEKRILQWKEQDAAWRKKEAETRGRRPRRPQKPKRPLKTEGQPGVLFNAMIHPFVGYTMRGSIWYQGEANAKVGRAPYDQTLPLMIRDWRTRWDSEFSFYFVQLANFRAASTEPGNNDPWPLLQDRMRRVLATTPKTGMAIINDVGEARDIHPKNKHDVGERLAFWALAKDYGQDRVYCGPLLADFVVTGNSATVRFEHAGHGLKSRDGEPLRRFEVAGADQVWHWADAKIVAADTVEVSSEQVSTPVAVRYAWAANPTGANLVNSIGLPASVFRTDEWNDVETP